MMVYCEKYKSLQIRDLNIKFVNGVAEVSKKNINTLKKMNESFGFVFVEEKEEEKKEEEKQAEEKTE